jgi:hypothetical protein
MMKPAGAVVFLASAIFFAQPQLGLPATVTARSRSSQFIVSGNLQPSVPSALWQRSVASNWVQLDPNLLAVSCERVKRALLWELGAPDRWRGQFSLALHPIQSPDEIIQVTSTRYSDGWRYRLDLPDAIDPERFVRTMVKLLLLEWVNRKGTAALVDVPSWLSEGLAEQVLADSTVELLVQTPRAQPNSLPMASTVRQERKPDALAKAHEFLRAHPPPALEELIAPKPTLLTGDAALAFRYSAQLLVHELLRLKNGDPCLCAFLDTLAFQPDAPTALLRAFGGHFQDQGDLEKWWELQALHFTGRDLAQAWPLRDGLRKLDEILRVAVLTRADTNSPTTRAEVPLQTAIADWTHAWQPDLVRFKVLQLQALQLRVPGNLAPLVNDYIQALQSFLQRIAAAQAAANATATLRFDAARIARSTAKQLDALDAKREAFRRKLAAPVNAGSGLAP